MKVAYVHFVVPPHRQRPSDHDVEYPLFELEGSNVHVVVMRVLVRYVDQHGSAHCDLGDANPEYPCHFILCQRAVTHQIVGRVKKYYSDSNLMHSAVKIDETGVCVNVDIRATKTKLMYGRKQLHVHFFDKDRDIAVTSIYDTRALQAVDAFPFLLHPPLNTFLYPSPIFIVRYDTDGAVCNLPVEEFAAMYERLKYCNVVTNHSTAVYDVPAIPLDTLDAEEQIEDAYDEIEDELSDNEELSDDEEAEDEDEWIDEDDVSAV